jgi:hypothetical protein
MRWEPPKLQMLPQMRVDGQDRPRRGLVPGAEDRLGAAAPWVLLLFF